MTEPQPPDPSWPRYSTRPFPAYRFVPGGNPHPRRDPKGHSFGLEEPQPTLLPPGEWRQSEDYLYGIDLYNYAFWWESHEIFEGLWHRAGHHTEQGSFFQALIQVSAAHLKVFMDNHRAARNLLHNGLLRLQRVPESYMGIDVASLIEELSRYSTSPNLLAPLIRLNVANLAE